MNDGNVSGLKFISSFNFYFRHQSNFLTFTHSLFPFIFLNDHEFTRQRWGKTNSDMPSVLERLATCPQLPYCSLSLPTVIPSLHCLRSAFAMFSFGVLCSWSFPIIAGAFQSSPELHSLPWGSPVFAGVPPCPPEFLLLPQSSCPLEFFGDSSRGFPCLLRAFLLFPMMLLSHHCQEHGIFLTFSLLFFTTFYVVLSLSEPLYSSAPNVLLSVF